MKALFSHSYALMGKINKCKIVNVYFNMRYVAMLKENK